MDILNSFLEIIKYIVPALVVYFLMRQFVRGNMAIEQMKLRGSMRDNNKALRLQAYERLILFCERINIGSLAMRLNTTEMNTAQLKNAMLISIQKEYEHNLTQQIYISTELWQMITLLKDNAIASISNAFIQHEKDDKASFESTVFTSGNSLDATIGQKVKEAIRKEVEIYFQ